MPIGGTTLIRRVYDRAAQASRADAVYVATDDDRIEDHVIAFGGRVVRPEGLFATGTDRIAASLDEASTHVIAQAIGRESFRFRRRPISMRWPVKVSADSSKISALRLAD